MKRNDFHTLCDFVYKTLGTVEMDHQPGVKPKPRTRRFQKHVHTLEEVQTVSQQQHDIGHQSVVYRQMKRFKQNVDENFINTLYKQCTGEIKNIELGRTFMEYKDEVVEFIRNNPDTKEALLFLVCLRKVVEKSSGMNIQDSLLKLLLSNVQLPMKKALIQFVGTYCRKLNEKELIEWNLLWFVLQKAPKQTQLMIWEALVDNVPNFMLNHYLTELLQHIMAGLVEESVISESLRLYSTVLSYYSNDKPCMDIFKPLPIVFSILAQHHEFGAVVSHVHRVISEFLEISTLEEWSEGFSSFLSMSMSLIKDDRHRSSVYRRELLVCICNKISLFQSELLERTGLFPQLMEVCINFFISQKDLSRETCKDILQPLISESPDSFNHEMVLVVNALLKDECTFKYGFMLLGLLASHRRLEKASDGEIISHFITVFGPRIMNSQSLLFADYLDALTKCIRQDYLISSTHYAGAIRILYYGLDIDDEDVFSQVLKSIQFIFEHSTPENCGQIYEKILKTSGKRRVQVVETLNLIILKCKPQAITPYRVPFKKYYFALNKDPNQIMRRLAIEGLKNLCLHCDASILFTNDEIHSLVVHLHEVVVQDFTGELVEYIFMLWSKLAEKIDFSRYCELIVECSGNVLSTLSPFMKQVQFQQTMIQALILFKQMIVHCDLTFFQHVDYIFNLVLPFTKSQFPPVRYEVIAVMYEIHKIGMKHHEQIVSMGRKRKMDAEPSTKRRKVGWEGEVDLTQNDLQRNENYTSTFISNPQIIHDKVLELLILIIQEDSSQKNVNFALEKLMEIGTHRSLNSRWKQLMNALKELMCNKGNFVSYNWTHVTVGYLLHQYHLLIFFFTKYKNQISEEVTSMLQARVTTLINFLRDPKITEVAWQSSWNKYASTFSQFQLQYLQEKYLQYR